MVYDAAAAASAQAWSESMLASNAMAHSASDARVNCGENLAMAYGGASMLTTPRAVKMWYDEICDPGYDFTNPGYTSGIGHFSQVVWVGSTKLGCGESGGWVTCRYCEDAGNMSSTFETNVLASSGGLAGCEVAADAYPVAAVDTSCACDSTCSFCEGVSADGASAEAPTTLAASKCITCNEGLVLTEATTGDGFGTCAAAAEVLPALTAGCIAAVATPA